MRILTALSVATIALWAAGCATNHENDRAAMDRALENTLRAEMSRYGDLAANAPDVRFTARDGTVTVSGAVPSEKDREMLSSLVRNTAGVIAVNDNLRVLNPPTGVVAPARIYSQPPVTVQTAPVYSVAPAAIVPGTVTVVPGSYPNLRMMAATPDDELLARRVADQLALDGIAGAWIDGAKITISDQTAYLKGVVDSPEIRQSVVSSISRTKGLRAVYDQLLVR